MLAIANAKGEIRGYVANPHTEVPRKVAGKLDVGTAVGKGMLSVIKDMGLGEPYVGTVPLVTGEIGDDISRYLLDSEQIPSATGLGVKVAPEGNVLAAGGFMMQVLPNADEKVIRQLELNIANLIPVSTMIADNFTAEEIMNDIMLGVPYKVLETNELTYKCNCSHEKISAAIISLGYKEVKAILEEQGEAEVICRFCGKKHYFGKDELKKIVDELDRKRFEKFVVGLNNQIDLQMMAAEQEKNDKNNKNKLN